MRWTQRLHACKRGDVNHVTRAISNVAHVEPQWPSVNGPLRGHKLATAPLQLQLLTVIRLAAATAASAIMRIDKQAGQWRRTIDQLDRRYVCSLTHCASTRCPGMSRHVVGLDVGSVRAAVFDGQQIVHSDRGHQHGTVPHRPLRVCVCLCVPCVSPQACFKFNSAVIRMTRTIAKEVLACISHRYGRGATVHTSKSPRKKHECTYVYPTVQSLCKRRSHHSDVVNVYLSKVVVGIVRVRSRVARLHCQ